MSKETESLVKQESEAIGVVRGGDAKAIVLDAPLADKTNDFRVGPPPPCEGCHGPAHGATNLAFACILHHLRAARSAAGVGPPTQCKGCGQTHRAVDEQVLCMESTLAASRAREGVGVSPEQFRLNQAQSRHFESTRGKNKKGGGG